MAVTSAERKALSKLPSALSRWEVGIIAMPVPIEGVDAEGILVVVEQGTGLARAGAPLVRGDPLWPVVRDACLSAGSGGHPSSPRALCTTRDLAPRLRRDVEGSGIQVEIVDALPHVAQLEQAWMSHTRLFRPPDLSSDGPLWRQTLSLLCQIEPWRTLPDRVTFRFDTSDPDLAAAVAVVLGKAGEQEGVALYRSVEGYERFLEAAIARDPDLPVADALCLYIDPLTDLSDSEVREIRSLELVLPGGRAPRLIAIRDGLPRAPDSQEQRMLLAATEAIARLSLTHLARLDSEPHEAALSTCLGPMTVRSHPGATKRRPEPAPPGTLVSDIEHAVIFSKVQIPHEDRPHEELESIVVKAGKRDAQKIASRLSAARAFAVERFSGVTRVVLHEGDRPLGVLCEIPLAEDRAQRLVAAHALVLSVSAGGPKRHQIRNADIVLSKRLSAHTSGAKPRHDPIFDRPPEEWPKISEALLRFAQQVIGPAMEHLPIDTLRATLKVASTVWNGVVLADFAATPGPLEEARQRVKRDKLGPGPLIEAMIAAKREHFPGDPRLIGEVEVGWRNGQPWITAKATLPANYTLGR